MAGMKDGKHDQYGKVRANGEAFKNRFRQDRVKVLLQQKKGAAALARIDARDAREAEKSKVEDAANQQGQAPAGPAATEPEVAEAPKVVDTFPVRDMKPELRSQAQFVLANDEQGGIAIQMRFAPDVRDTVIDDFEHALEEKRWAREPERNGYSYQYESARDKPDGTRRGARLIVSGDHEVMAVLKEILAARVAPLLAKGVKFPESFKALLEFNKIAIKEPEPRGR